MDIPILDICKNMEKRIKYPLGEQSFELLREDGMLYIDKTMYIKTMLDLGNKYYFLGRPRRFGKSLFLSTLKCFFEGKKELFKGLYIYDIDWEWKEYPVLRIDLNKDKYAEIGMLDDVLDSIFRRWEEKYDVKIIAENLGIRFSNIIRAAYEKTGERVVILIDEYDKPLVGNINRSDEYEHYRNKLSSIYSNFKSCSDYIRMMFMTGVSRFSKLSIFSDLNNINEMGFDDDFSDICGISERELHKYFQQGIQGLAEEMNVSYDSAAKLLKENYDGYRFSKNGSEMYNPWSVLSAMQKKEIANYWNDTGFPSLIAEMLENTNQDLEDVFNSECGIDELKGLDLQSTRPIALLYQTGYLTIKDYNYDYQEYQVGIPNKEVKTGLFNILLPYYVSLHGKASTFMVTQFVKDLNHGLPDEFMKRLQSFFASISYRMQMDDETNFHNAMYVFMELLGLRVQTEVETSEGRIDILSQTKDYIYIIELKYDGSAEKALLQIEQKNYAMRFAADNRKIFKIGVNFSSKERRIDSWIIKYPPCRP